MNGLRKIWMMAAGLWCLMTASAQTVDSIGWRQVFTEPQLVSLIETALERNADLRTANLNVVQAEAQLKAARLAFLPSLTVGAEGQLSPGRGHETIHPAALQEAHCQIRPAQRNRIPGFPSHHPGWQSGLHRIAKGRGAKGELVVNVDQQPVLVKAELQSVVQLYVIVIT